MVIDASVLVSALLTDDAHHAQSSELLRALVASRGSAAVPVLAWAEVAGAIARRTDSADLAHAALAFLDRQDWLTALPVDAALARRATRLAAGQRLRGADAIYVALAVQRSEVLVTLDKEHLRRAPNSVKACTPREYLDRSGIGAHPA